MNTTACEDVFDTALSMIDLGRWGLRARVFSELRLLQRASHDGWVFVSYVTLAQRLGCSSRYLYGLMGAADRPGVGSLWRIERVLVRGERGAGHRPTAYRINVATENWRGIPWTVDRETRRLRFAALRGLDRGANGGLAPRSPSAELANLAPRSPSAELADLAPRSRARSYEPISSAIGDRGASNLANGSEGPVSPSSSNSLRSTATAKEQEQEGRKRQIVDYLEAKTGLEIDGPTLLRDVELLAAFELGAVLAAFKTAPANYLGPKLVRHAMAVCTGRIRPAGGPDPAARAATIRRLIATRKGLGEDTAELAAELEQCENGHQVNPSASAPPPEREGRAT